MTRFDLSVDADLDCTIDQPCDFAWETTWGFAQSVRSGQLQRVWWFDEGGPQRFIVATDNTQEFIDAATDVVESAQELATG